MPRKLHYSEPQVINYVENLDNGGKPDYLIFETGNEDKVKEIKRILKGYNIASKKLDIEEIQSLDPFKVVARKAQDAWRLNNYNPIIVEDTSLDILGLENRPSTYTKDFLEDINIRRMICEEWLDGKDRRVAARVLLAMFDGKDTHIREGKTTGTISKKLLGSYGFGWDDMFIPDGQNTKSPKTFAQMPPKEKDKFSMRRKALEALSKDPFIIKMPIFMLNEPYEQEIERVSFDKLKDRKAIRFAYSLECLEGTNKHNGKLEALGYKAIKRTKNIFYTRFTHKKDTKSLGLILTDVDRNNVRIYENGEPYIWQMGPERRQLALAQRVDFFQQNQNREVYNTLGRIEKNKNNFPKRSCRRSRVVERFLGVLEDGIVTKAVALKELGYKKLSSSTNREVSRTSIAASGLFTMIGKYPRSIFCIGSMPPVSGWRDVVVTAAIAHSPVFTTRNSIFAGDINRQVDLINDAKNVLKSFGLNEKNYNRVERNIGAALASGNIKEEVENAKLLNKKANVRLFRIYTINSDKRVVELSHALRSEFGDEVEIFVGQVIDKNQCLKLIEKDTRVDGLIFGHGGGRQCTSATNGMAITALEEIYSVASDRRFLDTTLIIEGGVGTSVSGVLLLGVDGISYNQQLTRGTIETGDIFFQHKSGKICHPYHGSASAPTMIIESANPKIRDKRMSASGRALNVEGKPGYTYYSEKANSMTFYINEFRSYAARMLADLGVTSIAEFRKFLNEYDEDLLRIVSSEAQVIASPYGTK